MEEKLESAESKPVVVVQKKKKGKKRKISKHIAEAAATKRAKADEATTTIAAARGTTKIAANKADASPNKKKRKSATAAVKDPAEAAAYLITWQKHQKDASAATWKFNKCTQSWLIRHMYEADKVSKGNFTLLLDYIKSGDKNTVQRCLEEATRRALRYQQNQQSSSHEQKDEESDSKNKDKEEDEKETGKEKAEDGSGAQVNGADEEARWSQLDEHDKRKEYKRARKVLDTLS